MTASGSRGAANATIVVAAVAATTALYFGRAFFIPLTLGLILTTLLVPTVAYLRRWHVPAPASAALTVLGSLALIVGAGFALEPPLRDLAAEVPKSIAAARARLARFREPLARLGIPFESQPQARTATPTSAARSRSDSATQGAKQPDSTHTGAADSAKSSVPAGAPARPSRAQGSSGTSPSSALAAAGRVFGVTTELVSELVEVLLLAFFLLAAGSQWREKLGEAVRSPENRRTTVQVVEEMRAVVGRYVIVTALINVGQAVLVALVIWMLGLPSPLLWGMLTFVAEFVPYLGGLVMIGLLLLSGLASGVGLLQTLLAPIAYLVITTLQNNLVSPVAYGRGLRLNPTAILIAVMFWWFLWGVAGAFVAVPILAAIRVLAAHVESLRPVGVFLAE